MRADFLLTGRAARAGTQTSSRCISGPWPASGRSRRWTSARTCATGTASPVRAARGTRCCGLLRSRWRGRGLPDALCADALCARGSGRAAFYHARARLLRRVRRHRAGEPGRALHGRRAARLPAFLLLPRVAGPRTYCCARVAGPQSCRRARVAGPQSCRCARVAGPLAPWRVYTGGRPQSLQAPAAGADARGCAAQMCRCPRRAHSTGSRSRSRTCTARCTACSWSTTYGTARCGSGCCRRAPGRPTRARAAPGRAACGSLRAPGLGAQAALFRMACVPGAADRGQGATPRAPRFAALWGPSRAGHMHAGHPRTD